MSDASTHRRIHSVKLASGYRFQASGFRLVCVSPEARRLKPEDGLFSSSCLSSPLVRYDASFKELT